MTQAFVTPEATATVGTVEVQGRPYQVQRAGWARPGEAVGVATLPVAGTYITQYNLAGEWMVENSLHGRPLHQGYFTPYAPQQPRPGRRARVPPPLVALPTPRS